MFGAEGTRRAVVTVREHRNVIAIFLPKRFWVKGTGNPFSHKGFPVIYLFNIAITRAHTQLAQQIFRQTKNGARGRGRVFTYVTESESRIFRRIAQFIQASRAEDSDADSAIGIRRRTPYAE